MVFPFGWSAQGRTEVATAPSTPRPRPKIGLALSAGAARGWSEIGVLREFIENGFEPDVVVGTSIGAVVGGCYCAGRLDQIEAFALSLSKRRVFGLMDFTLSGMGLLAGGRLKSRLESELGAAEVDDLPVRFASVATEVHTGHEVWLSRGRLVDAIRASYALPGLFEPICVEGRWLMDGALVNPIPVSVCRALGADVVIAVNLIAETLGRASQPVGTALAMQGVVPPPVPAAGVLQGWWGSGRSTPRTPTASPSTAPGIASVIVDAFNITQDRIARSRLAGDPPDVTINVRCGKIGLFDFHRATELIAIGREATQRAMPDLRDAIGLHPRIVATPSAV